MSVKIRFRRGGGNFTPETALDVAEPYYNPVRKIVGIGDGTTNPPHFLMEDAAQTVKNKTFDESNKIVQPNEVGLIMLWPTNVGANIPDKYLVCDGAPVSRTRYDQLFVRYGTTYGSGNGSTTFNLPSLTFENANFSYVVRALP